MYIYIYIYIHVCICANLCVHILFYLYTYIHTYIHTYMSTHTYAYLPTYLPTYQTYLSLGFRVYRVSVWGCMEFMLWGFMESPFCYSEQASTPHRPPSQSPTPIMPKSSLGIIPQDTVLLRFPKPLHTGTPPPHFVPNSGFFEYYDAAFFCGVACGRVVKGFPYCSL